MPHRLEIMLHVKALHDKGLALRDFAERNVVCRNGDYRLIDFHDTDNHTCEWDGDLHVGKGMPVGLICRYMLDCGLDMHFWPPRESTAFIPRPGTLTTDTSLHRQSYRLPST